MIAKTIENLREKPEHHRRRVALGVSGFITMVVFTAWISVLMPSTAGTLVRESEVAQEEVRVAQNGETPLSVLRNGFANAYVAIKGLWDVDIVGEYQDIRTQVETGNIQALPQGEIGR